MNWETWEKYKDALANENWTAWAKWPADVQDAMREIDPANRQCLTADATWPRVSYIRFFPGTTYRVNPSWPGPSKPELVEEYDDCAVGLSGDRSVYTYTYQSLTCSHVRTLENAMANPRFAGYVMPDGPLAKCLIFDQQTDGTWRLSVPLAVRLRKEVAQ